ncbi:MAG: hypothetical protein LUF02_10025 [Erysipelotrichaceae bacterium]|nr:hypothetical protein [Erysipelotrichaceae bacterium]
MYKELLPYCIRCAVNDIHIDYDMIRAVYHIPNFMKLYKFENDGKYITLTFGMDSECPEEYIKVVRLTEGQYYEYINKDQYPYYVVYLEEIYAWQNNMKLYQEIRQYKDIEDCSFYLLDDDLIKHVLKYVNHHVFDENLECDENEAFFYYEEDEIF